MSEFGSDWDYDEPAQDPTAKHRNCLTVALAYRRGLVTSKHDSLLLLSISGIGPRLAVTILSTLTPDSIRRAIFNEQAEVFNRVPGVGKKTAQKIIISLQDKISADEGFEPIAAMSEADSEVLSALVALGYSVVEAQSALQSIPHDAPQEVEERLRLALRYFS